MRRTSIPWGRTPRTIYVDGIPLLIVDKATLAEMKARTGSCLMADLDGATPLDHHTTDPEETTP